MSAQPHKNQRAHAGVRGEPASLELILVELASLHRKVDALQASLHKPSQLSAEQQDLVVAMASVVGAGFVRANDVLNLASSLDIGDRPKLRAALAALNVTNPQSMGLCLAAIAALGGRAGGWQLSRHQKAERGAALWVLERHAWDQVP